MGKKTYRAYCNRNCHRGRNRILHKEKGCSCDCDEDFSDDFEDEDFDLDDDLKEVSREYVSLTPEPAKETEETDSTEDSPAAETEEE